MSRLPRSTLQLGLVVAAARISPMRLLPLVLRIQGSAHNNPSAHLLTRHFHESVRPRGLAVLLAAAEQLQEESELSFAYPSPVSPEMVLPTIRKFSINAACSATSLLTRLIWISSKIESSSAKIGSPTSLPLIRSLSSIIWGCSCFKRQPLSPFLFLPTRN